MWKLTLSSGTEKPLPEDIKLIGGVRLGHQLKVSSQGVAKYRPADEPDPVVITLMQPLGHDKTLLDLFALKAGFKLKLTLSLPMDDGNGGVTYKDILDINLSDLVPDDLHFDEALVLVCRTLTEPEINWIENAPQRRTVKVGAKK
jgi:hypothetical protein